jgi:hypothetical protein
MSTRKLKSAFYPFLYLLVAVVVATIPAGNLYAQAVVTGHVFAEVVEGLTVEETTQLNFGRFYPETSGGNINVYPDGSRSVSGDVSLLGMVTPASFTVTGQADATFSISLPFQPAIITNLANAKTMIVDKWASLPVEGTNTGVLTGGTQVVKVGATLFVKSKAENPAGMYSGTYSISFNYN